jgi:hypothetical protein
MDEIMDFLKICLVSITLYNFENANKPEKGV